MFLSHQQRCRFVLDIQNQATLNSVYLTNISLIFLRKKNTYSLTRSVALECTFYRIFA